MHRIKIQSFLVSSFVILFLREDWLTKPFSLYLKEGSSLYMIPARTIRNIVLKEMLTIINNFLTQCAYLFFSLFVIFLIV